jgi:hypothetical protein
MARDQSLRRHLIGLLDGGNAHATFDAAVAGLPAGLRGSRAHGIPHTPWRLLEHLRIAQWDILEFSRNAKHVSPDWPGGYWPKEDAPADSGAWQASIDRFQADLEAMKALVLDPAVELFAKIPHGDGQTVLREALLVADHNAYHIGQLIVVRRALGAWKDE